MIYYRTQRFFDSIQLVSLLFPRLFAKINFCELSLRSIALFMTRVSVCLHRIARRNYRSARTEARYVARWIYMVYRGSRDNVVVRMAVPAPAVFTETMDTRSSIKRAVTSSVNPWNDFLSVVISSEFDHVTYFPRSLSVLLFESTWHLLYIFIKNWFFSNLNIIYNKIN